MDVKIITWVYVLTKDNYPTLVSYLTNASFCLCFTRETSLSLIYTVLHALVILQTFSDGKATG